MSGYGKGVETVVGEEEESELSQNEIAKKKTNEENDSNHASKKKSDEVKPQLASFAEVFSFADSKARWYMAGALASAVLAGLVMPAMIFYFAKAFEDLAAPTEGNFMDTVRELTYTFLILGVMIFVFMTTQATLQETAGSAMTRNMQTAWFRALLRQDMAYFDLQSDVVGQATMISSNGSKYKKGVGRKLSESLQFFVVFAGSMVYSFYASWRTSLSILAVAPFMVLSNLFLVKMNTTQTARANATYAAAGSIATTAVQSIRTILALDAVEKMIAWYTSATKKAYDGAVHDCWLLGVANGSIMASFIISYVMVTLLGSFFLYDNVRDTGCDPSGTIEGADRCDPAGVDVFGSLMGITFAASVLPQISVGIEAFWGARAAAYPAIQAIQRRAVESNDDGGVEPSHGGKDDVEQDEAEMAKTDSPNENVLPTYRIDSSSDAGLQPSSVNGEIEFRSVQFAYPARSNVNVFTDFNLKIEPGKTVAICGPSGSGKSTVVQLIERFYDPQLGGVYLDGTNLQDLNVGWLRRQIGLVSQEPKLFAGSIRENIAVGLEGATQEQIEEAARQANAHDFIMSFPSGYDTEVGDMGSQMSGGQKQRLALSRVLVSNPKVLLLDESTSALDSESERIVQEALDDLMQKSNMTVVVIAHRLSTIRNSDAIAVIVDGRVIEMDTHQNLIEQRGHYYELVQAQQVKPTTSQSDSINTSQHMSDDSTRGSVLETNAESSVTTPIIRFRNVHFHYPARPDNLVFRDLNLDVHRGETLAIVGPSGCGKSTVTRLIECFYRPTQGSVEYNGVDMAELNVKWLRGHELGLVSQEPALFDCSIIENIRFGFEATAEQVEEAAKEANCHDFIIGFPDRYETRVGQGSNLLSGGQKQRIAIARALLRKPHLLLLDEATSALDSKSEEMVQSTLDKIMASRKQTVIMIAHRLSTVRNADRIAVIDKRKVCEIGTHDELLARPNGRYRRLHAMQDLSAQLVEIEKKGLKNETKEKKETKKDRGDTSKWNDEEFDEAHTKDSSEKARVWAKDDMYYFFVGSVGAVFAGILFPAWGFVFAYMIELVYTPVSLCPPVPEGFGNCDEYFDDTADQMQEKSFNISYTYIGLMAATLFGNGLLFWGFGTASERMNKRVRDAAFSSLLRQEIAWFDVRSPGAIVSQLADDAALIHAFSGQPIRSLVVSLASVLLGVIVSFVYMWPFALIALALVPFLGFGAEMETRMYWGDDEGDHTQMDEGSPGTIVVETLANMRTIASLTLESERDKRYERALIDADPRPILNNMVKGSGSGLGQLIQMWCFGLMFFWGGWLLFEYPDSFTYREYLISMFSIFFALYGLAVAFEGTVDRDKAQQAANRIFALIDRQSEIDPLSDSGQTISVVEDYAPGEGSLTRESETDDPVHVSWRNGIDEELWC